MTCSIASIINQWIEAKLNLPFIIENDVISSPNGDAACLRHDPAPAAEHRYIDGSRLIKWNLSYYIRSSDRTKARQYAYSITDKLDGTTIPAGSNGVNIDIEAQTLPQYISVDDKNNTIYCASITCTYIEPKELEE